MKNFSLVLCITWIVLGPGAEGASFLQLKKACSKGEMQSCFQLGMMFESGDQVREDFAEAKNYFEKACPKGHTKACIGLGDLYERELGVEKDLVRARTFYAKACKAGDGEGCYSIGRLEENAHHMKKALSMYDQACQKKFAMACSTLGMMYDFGREIKKNEMLARDYYQKACSLDGVFCDWLGNAYENGKLGVQKDIKKAYHYYERSCKGKSAEGCYKVGNFYFYGKSIPKNYSKAVYYYRKSCSMSGAGVAKGCNNLGVLYSQGKGVEKDRAYAEKYYKKACKLGYFDACDQLKDKE